MLTLFEVQDLPLRRAVRIGEHTPVAEAARLASEVPAVLVEDATGRVCGVVETRSIRLAAQERPERELGELSRSGVVAVAPTTCLVDAVRAVSGLGVGALLVTEGWLITREELLDFDAWGTLVEARESRLAREQAATA